MKYVCIKIQYTQYNTTIENTDHALSIGLNWCVVKDMK